MAFKCGTSTWKSWIFPLGNIPNSIPEHPNDGFFDTGDVNTAGDFDGFHRNGAPRPIRGKCVDAPAHLILINRTDGPADHHLYLGKITVVNGKDVVAPGNGRHRRSGTPFPELTDADWNFAAPMALADDEWVGEKTT